MASTGSYFYRFAHKGIARKDRTTLAQAVRRIDRELTRLDLRDTGISEYSQRYLRENLEFGATRWPIITYLLGTVVNRASCHRRREGLVFVDYGGGTGMLSLVAKAFGIGTVIYCDVYDTSCRDAQTIAALLGLEADHYVTGEVADLVRTLNERHLRCDIIASVDCIEHIYNIEEFLGSMVSIPSDRLVLWHSSSANPCRKRTRRMMETVHRKAELEDREPEKGDKQRDTRLAFLAARKKIVAKLVNQLSDGEIEELARRTRGQRREDIERAVRSFLETNIYPAGPDHPTNTCDPYTGNWAERLMDPFWLRKIVTECGIDAVVKPGYWAGEPGAKLLAKWIANAVLSVTGNRALWLAPYYVLLGETRKETSPDRSGWYSRA